MLDATADITSVEEIRKISCLLNYFGDLLEGNPHEYGLSGIHKRDTYRYQLAPLWQGLMNVLCKIKVSLFDQSTDNTAYMGCLLLGLGENNRSNLNLIAIVDHSARAMPYQSLQVSTVNSFRQLRINVEVVVKMRNMLCPALRQELLLAYMD